MSDLDVIDFEWAQEAINMPGSGANHGLEIQLFITAVSQRIDAICGPVVVRDVVETFRPASNQTVILHDWVSWPSSDWPLQEITQLTEYTAGVGANLTGETLTVSGDYLVVDGHLGRRSAFSTSYWRGPIEVTYTAGRYADTAAVGERFQLAAAQIVARMWPQYAAIWSRGVSSLGGMEGSPGFFRSVDPVIEELLPEDKRPPAVA